MVRNANAARASGIDRICRHGQGIVQGKTLKLFKMCFKILLRGNACACLNCGSMKCTWRKKLARLNRSLELGRNLDSGRQPPEYGRAAVTKRGVRLLKWG